jgi:hypothetical protein
VIDAFCLYSDHLVVKEALEKLESLDQSRKIHDHLERGCLKWITGSEFPIHAALKSSQFFSELFESKKDPFFQKKSSEFTSIALSLTRHIIADNEIQNRLTQVNKAGMPKKRKSGIFSSKITGNDESKTTIASDMEVVFPVRVSIRDQVEEVNFTMFHFLFNSSDGQESVIDILHAHYNSEFLGDADIASICEDGWKAEPNAKFYSKYYHAPSFKYFVNCTALTLYISAFLLHFYISRNNVDRDFERLEYFIYIGSLSYILNELIKIFEKGFKFKEALKGIKKILSSGWGLIDLLFTLSITLTAILRVSGLRCQNS